MRSILATVPLAALLMMIAAPARAQTEDAQLWFQTNAQVPVAKNLRVTLEGIARFSDNSGGLFHTEIGSIIEYKVADNIQIGFGYRHVGSHGGSTADDEDRLRQHVVATFGRIATRFRIDERFHPDGDEIGIRIRPLIRYNHPIGRKKGLALFVSHESFFMANSTDWGQRAGYDRMRNIVGVVLPIAKGVSGDLGYLDQYRFGRGGSEGQIDHALSFQLNLAL